MLETWKPLCLPRKRNHLEANGGSAFLFKAIYLVGKVVDWGLRHESDTFFLGIRCMEMRILHKFMRLQCPGWADLLKKGAGGKDFASLCKTVFRILAQSQKQITSVTTQFQHCEKHVENLYWNQDPFLQIDIPKLTPRSSTHWFQSLAMFTTEKVQASAVPFGS